MRGLDDKGNKLRLKTYSSYGRQTSFVWRKLHRNSLQELC